MAATTEDLPLCSTFESIGVKDAEMRNQGIKTKIENFVRDPNLEKVMSWQMTFNIFEISAIKETQHSSIIAWLLDPNESHNLGSRFIKSLLRAAKFKFEDCKKDSKCQKRAFMNNSFLSDWSYYDIEISSFQHVQVVTEFKAGKRIKSGYDAVDICVLDQNNSLLVIIENKYGSRDYRKLPNYYEYLQDNFRDLKYKLYICLDAYVPLKNIDDNWIGLSYDWIESFCEEAIEKETLTPKVEMILTDYLECIGDEIHTKCQKDLEGNFAKLSHDHRELLDLLRTEKITTSEGDKKIRDLYHIEDLYSANINPSSIRYHLIMFYWKYYDIIEKLYQYNTFHLIKNEIEKSLPNTELEFYFAQTYLYFVNKEWFFRACNNSDSVTIIISHLPQIGQVIVISFF